MDRCRSADGTTISFERVGAGPSVVLVHAAISDHRYWAEVVQRIADRYTVYVMDRRGRGESGPFRPDHTIERDYEDVLAVVRAAEPPVHLVGHSSGARYAMHAALGAPDLVSLTLYEPALFRPIEEPILETLARAEAERDAETALTVFLRDVLRGDDTRIAARRRSPIWDYWLELALTLPPELRSLTDYRFDAAAFSTLRLPTLLLLGSQSPPAMRVEVESVAGAFPEGRIAILPGQGHSAVTEAPDLLAREIRSFLSEVEAVRPDG